MICINFVALKRPISSVATDKLKVTVSLTCGRKMICCTHTHIHLTALCLGLPRWAGTRKVKPIWLFTEARDSEWQWHQLGHMQVCTLLQTDNHASSPPLSFLQAGCPSCRPTNSVRALKWLKAWCAAVALKYQAADVCGALPWSCTKCRQKLSRGGWKLHVCGYLHR